MGLVASLLGCGVLVAGIFLSRGSSLTNEESADQLASALIASAPLPPHAVPASGSAARASIGGIGHVGIPTNVDEKRRYVVPMALDTLVDYLAVHVPTGLKTTERGSSTGPGGSSLSLTDTLSAGAKPPIAAAQLGLAARALDARHSLLLADAFVAWYPDRPADEVVTAGDSSLLVGVGQVLTPSLKSPPLGFKVIAVHNATLVHRVVELLNGLPVAPDVAVMEPNCSAADAGYLFLDLLEPTAHRAPGTSFLARTPLCLLSTRPLFSIEQNGATRESLEDWDDQLIDLLRPTIDPLLPAALTDASTSIAGTH